MYYEFTDDCLIGVEQIDEEHRGLFRLVGEVHDLLDSDLTDGEYEKIYDLIERLKQYAVVHFRHEEEYMEKIGHPEIEQQKQQHAQFCAKVNEVDIRSHNGDQRALISDLLSYLVKWLYKHIIGSDSLIGKLVPLNEWKQKRAYEFTDRYLTGIEFIDEEHKELFQIIEELHNNIENEFIPDKIVNLIENLINNTRIHFDDEEKYMESINHDGLDVQKIAHDVFLTRLEMMVLGEIHEEQQDDLQELLLRLTEWLINHIMQMDKRIGQSE